MGDFETYLNGRSMEGKEMVLKVVESLGSALVYPDSDNVSTNRKLWDSYAKEWGPEERWVQSMASDKENHVIDCLGDEWSCTKDLEYVIERFITPNLGPQVAEIGSGGGRVAQRVCSRVSELHCYDISQEMLKTAQETMKNETNVQYHLIKDAESIEKTDFFDFVYAFDVFVHMDLHTMFQYFKAIRKMLKDGGKAFVSTANLLTPDGWKRFENQSKYSVGGFYFVSPEIVQEIVRKSQLKIVSVGSPQEDAENVYLMRDYLIVLEKNEF